MTRLHEIARCCELAEAKGLARLIEDRLAREPDSGAAAEPLGQAVLVCGGAGSTLSRAYGLGFDGPMSSAALDRLVGFYEERGRPCTVELCPYAEPSLLPSLHHRGFGVTGFTDLLVRELDGEEGVGSDLPPGVSVHQVDRSSPEACHRAAAVIAGGFAEGKTPDDDAVAGFVTMILQPTGAAFIASIDGEAAGGGLMACGDGCVSLFGASTLPAARRRGIQGALIRARVAEGRARGAQLAVIQGAPGEGTRRNAERQGFWLAYTKARLSSVA